MYFIVHSNYCKNYIFWHTAIAAKSGPTSVTYSCMLIYIFNLYACGRHGGSGSGSPMGDNKKGEMMREKAEERGEECKGHEQLPSQLQG
jgi:hypothetical protein